MRKILPVLVFCFIALTTLFMPAKALAYDLFVDKDNDTGTENGSETDPYNTISEATEAAMGNDSAHRSIHVSNGTYSESIGLGEYVRLYGESNQETIISGEGRVYAVEMNNNSFIQGFMISGGDKGIVVAKNTTVSIQDMKINKSNLIGIEILESSKNNNGKVTVKNTEIYDGTGKGMYIQKRKIEITGSKIHDNDEEGIDIRSKVSGVIKSNNIYNNGESGIETLANKADLSITKNTIKNNKSNAITVQYYDGSGDGGKIKINGNKMTQNKKFAIGCATPSGGNHGKNYWNKRINLLSNVYEKNKLGKIQSKCKLK